MNRRRRRFDCFSLVLDMTLFTSIELVLSRVFYRYVFSCAFCYYFIPCLPLVGRYQTALFLINITQFVVYPPRQFERVDKE